MGRCCAALAPGPGGGGGRLVLYRLPYYHAHAIPCPMIYGKARVSSSSVVVAHHPRFHRPGCVPVWRSTCPRCQASITCSTSCPCVWKEAAYSTHQVTALYGYLIGMVNVIQAAAIIRIIALATSSPSHSRIGRLFPRSELDVIPDRTDTAMRINVIATGLRLAWS